MHSQSLRQWQHDHGFGLHRVPAAERRTLAVVALTAAMMVVEIAGGLAFGSMALLADGLHMASHTVALGITVIGYRYARRLAGDPRFSFGTGKVNALAGFVSAILLAVFAAGMAWESAWRLAVPVAIAFDQAILVAAVGLGVNLLSLLILRGRHDHGAEHPHTHHGPHDHRHHGDHNLRGAILHVMADAVTSLLALVALFGGKLFGAVWLDPLIGIAGALLVGRWAWGLARDSGGVLLDRQVDGRPLDALCAALESGTGDRVTDLHLWAVGPGIYAAAVAIVSDRPQSPDHYKALIPPHLGIVHSTVEVHRCPAHAATATV